MWRTIQILRVIDRQLEQARKSLDNRTKGYSIHGNRLIAHVIFKRLDMTGIENHAAEWSPVIDQARSMVLPTLNVMKDIGEAEYSGYTAMLFKNATKTDRLATLSLDALNAS